MHVDTESKEVGIELKPSAVEQTDLRTLVKHQEWVESTMPLGEVHRIFQEHKQDFCAVKENGHILGCCSSSQVAFLMGHRYGLAIYGKHPIKEHLVQHPGIVSPQRRPEFTDRLHG